MSSQTTKAPVDPKLAKRRHLTGSILLPLTILIMLPILFIGLMHQPGPRDMKVGIIGSEDQVSELMDQTEQATKGQFELVRFDHAEEAESRIEDREIRAAVDPISGDLYHASASGKQVDPIATQFLTSLADQTAEQAGHKAGAEIKDHDVVKAGPGDTMGTSALFLGIGAILGGMLTGVIISIIPTSPLFKVGAGLAVPLVVTLSELAIGWGGFGLFDGHAFKAGVVLLALGLTACAVSTGLMMLGGFFMLPVNILLVVILGITCSGIMMPHDMAPVFYEGMFQWLPTARGLDAFRATIYFDGAATLWDWLTMLFGAVAGVAMAVIAGIRRRSRTPEPSEETVLLGEETDTAALAAIGSAGAAAAA